MKHARAVLTGLIEISVSFLFSAVYLSGVYEVDLWFGRQNQLAHT